MTTNLSRIIDFIYANRGCTVDDMHDHIFGYPLPPTGHRERGRCSSNIHVLLCAARKRLIGSHEVLQATWSDVENCKQYAIDNVWIAGRDVSSKNGRASLEANLSYLHTFAANANQHTTAAKSDLSLTAVSKNAVNNLHLILSKLEAAVDEVYLTLASEQSEFEMAE